MPFVGGGGWWREGGGEDVGRKGVMMVLGGDTTVEVGLDRYKKFASPLGM